MYRYYLEFSKTGTIRFISHLDLLRLFKRAFKRSGIELIYSQGFNPHPKLGFAQPLSLGYEGMAEILEFETTKDYPEEEIKNLMNPLMPEGVRIHSCVRLRQEGKSLAALADAAVYQILLPRKEVGNEFLVQEFLLQKNISVEKRTKKKELVLLDIRPMIRKMDVEIQGDDLLIHCELDAGSSSNLSPELLLQAIRNFTGNPILGEEISILREKILFGNNFHL